MNKDIYRELCIKEPSIPLFSQAWWLDVTAGAEGWDVALVRKGDEVVASMPYTLRKYYGFSISTQPLLTQTLGPWFKGVGNESRSELSKQMKWMQNLIDQLPNFDYFNQNWTWHNQNWLPFYWNGFNQTTRYTYILDNLTDPNVLWDSLKENIKGDIKKAKNRFNIKVKDDLTVNDFLCLNKKTFHRQGIALPYSEQFVKKLDSACIERDARKIFIAVDEQGRKHAGVYIVWDKNCAYYLMGGGDPDLRASGATSLCMWEAIQFSATITRQFDFEGSMIKSVESFFRGFGGRQMPFFSISQAPSRLIKAAIFMRQLCRSF
jgi:hypothetical protein